ncbi:peptidoglycan recognition protein family protein [Paenibacillus naphthalenovorans]|uniref:peptidoglycan recognition protein family protein n=1 Tax=Paenibacillus naphthalenovorans TaxID=162209 RepID=UPI003D2BD0A7
MTVHNTGNPTSSARGERAWLTNPTNVRQASFHIVVDEREAVECIPLTENAWHAGDGRGDGNMRSISVEICESGDYAKTLANAAELVARLLKERGWGADRLRRHYDWSGKICPRLMYDGGTWIGWAAFKSAVAAKLNETEVEDVKLSESVANNIIDSYLSPEWFRCDAERRRAEAECRTDDAAAWRQLRDHQKFLADELRKAAGIA